MHDVHRMCEPDKYPPLGTCITRFKVFEGNTQYTNGNKYLQLYLLHTINSRKQENRGSFRIASGLSDISVTVTFLKYIFNDFFMNIL